MFDLTICCSHVACGTIIVAIKPWRTFLMFLGILNDFGIHCANKFSLCFLILATPPYDKL